MTETRSRVTVERVTLTSTQTFDDVLDGLYQGISRPNLAAAAKAWLGAGSDEEFEKVVSDAAGPAGLLQFMALDQGAALAKIPGVTHERMVRVLAGNPLTMTRMARAVPDAGSYVPVSILVRQDGDQVRLTYDTMESLLAPYGNDEALEVARDLDDKVLTLMREAAGLK
jgi:uncharacterized protein (DUF302 family)